MRKRLGFLTTICFLFLFLFLVTSCGTNINNDGVCVVSFDSMGGSTVESQNIESGKKATKPENPTKEGYTFVNWTYQGEVWSFIGYSVTDDMTLVANWEINSYDIVLNQNNIQAGRVTGGGRYDFDSKVTINATINPGYTFDGWYKGDTEVTKEQSYTFSMPANDVAYEARYTANTNTAYKVEHYQQNIDDNEYTLYETDNLTGKTNTLTNGSVKTYEGFTSPSITQVNIDGDGSTVIKLYYTRNSYTLTLTKNIDDAGTIIGSGTYKYGKEVTITSTNPGYTFNGWYDGETKVSSDSSYTFSMPGKNVSLEARYTINKYTITLDNQAEGVTISGITSGNAYEYESEITLTATNIPEGYVIKWERSDGVLSGGDSYTFNVPATNITITITKVTPNSIYSRVDSKIYFGSYPQALASNLTLSSELNTLAGDLPTSSNLGNWIDYNYYIEGTITSYMYYQDIDYDSDGTYDYRGVYFTQYRPYATTSSSSSSYQDNNGYSTRKVYWFKYEPIEWNILTESNGKALIIANLILDSQDYYPYSSASSLSHNGGTGYVNNYELSNIRKWLNDNFYNTAFNDLQKAIIETTEVDNSVASTGNSSNKYVCNNTNDKMFLLSREELTTYYTSDEARQAKGTDYAKCQGLWVENGNYYLGSSFWWSRSPYYNNACYVYYVNYYGLIQYDSYFVNDSDYGIRPACWINL